MFHVWSAEVHAGLLTIASLCILVTLWQMEYCATGVLVGVGGALVAMCRAVASGRPFVCQRHKRASNIEHVAVVTGASSGIGLEVAQGLAEQGWSLIITGRNSQRLESAKQSIKTGTPGATVMSYVLDMSDFSDVRQFCNHVKELNIGLLINNAGELDTQLLRTEGHPGLERMIATNALGPILLTELLLPTLRRTSAVIRPALGFPSRVVQVASCAHTMCGDEALREVQRLHPSAAVDPSSSPLQFTWTSFVYYYGLSKLCLIWYSEALASRMQRQQQSSDAVVVTCCHPGVIATRLYRNMLPEWCIACIYYVSLLICKSPKEGANSVLLAATSDDVGTGAYVLCDGDHGRKSKYCLLTPTAQNAGMGDAFCRWAFMQVGLHMPQSE